MSPIGPELSAFYRTGSPKTRIISADDALYQSGLDGNQTPPLPWHQYSEPYQSQYQRPALGYGCSIQPVYPCA